LEGEDSFFAIGNELWDIVNNTQSNPIIVPIDATLLTFQKKNVKAKRIILDAIKDHVIPHVAGKKMPTRCGNL
jgi:hypothetical protein